MPVEREALAATGSRVSVPSVEAAWPGWEGSPVRVDVAVARAFGARWSRMTGLFPFRLEGQTLWIATEWPMKELGRRIVAGLEPSPRLFRATAASLEAARRLAWGDEDDDQTPSAGTRFGDWAVRLGKATREAVDAALARQRSQGGRVGAWLVGMRAMTAWDVAEILGRQYGLPVVNLLSVPTNTSDPDVEVVWTAMPATFWRAHRSVPIAVDEGIVVLAMEDPADRWAVAALENALGCAVRPVVTGRRDIDAVLDQRYRAVDLATSRDGLAASRPEWSAKTLWTAAQRRLGIILGTVVVLALAQWGSLTLTVLSAFLTMTYMLLVGYRWWMIRQAADEPMEVRISDDELTAVNPKDLPVYTVLVPVRDEVEVLPLLARALDALDWPKDRLDVKLLVESDDIATLQAARSAELPPYVEIVTVPAAEPRTKPKACNYGLARARGEYLTIYDAEDIPEPLQLKKAYLVFSKADARLACVQAKLTYYNANQNLLTRWFTAEYAAWFDLYLPALYAAGHPIPLGGTSNHFRVAALRQLGGWDPYNVTEDADLGIRLARIGYRTTIVDAVTREEANSEFVNWMRQRSRWVKGYLTTWLVHMRSPVRLWKELGPRGFLGFQAALLGTVVPFLLNPVYWGLTSLWFLTEAAFIPRLFPPGIYYLGMISLLAGNFLFAYMNAIASARHGRWDLVLYSLLTPLYWGMMSVAAWKALLQLVTRPAHWEKTRHGLSFIPSLHDPVHPGTASTSTSP
jgi:cellulose synthase/poly-beta-1,6-N-acetylglucosamine synthase-like glycosyltransferase